MAVAVADMELRIIIQCGQAIKVMATIKTGITDKVDHTNDPNTMTETVVMAAPATEAIKEATAMEAATMEAAADTAGIEAEAALMDMMTFDHMIKPIGMMLRAKKNKPF